MSAVTSLGPTASRTSRILKRLLLAFGVLVGLFVLRLVVGLGSAYAHYNSTPDFETFVASRPVSQVDLESWLPPGEVLARDTAWSIGVPETEDSQALHATFEVTMEHGAEQLLKASVEVAMVMDPETYASLGYSILCPSIQTRAGLRAIVQVGVIGSERLVGEADASGGSLVVDVVLVAGEGPNEFRVTELEGTPTEIGQQGPGFSLLRSIFGIVHPLGELPDEGLMHQSRSRVSLTWRKVDGGAQSMGYSPVQGRTNCEEYSHKITVSVEEHDGGLKRTSSRSIDYKWNDVIW